MNKPASKFITCRCQHCDGGIEFDASTFDKGETRTATCPHCGLETILFVPAPPKQTAASKIITLYPTFTHWFHALLRTRPVKPKKTAAPSFLCPPSLLVAAPSRSRVNRTRIIILTSVMFGLTTVLIPLVFLLCARLTVHETEDRRQAQIQQQLADNADAQVNYTYEAAPGARAGFKRYRDEADALAAMRDVTMVGGFALTGFCCLIWVPGAIYLFVTGGKKSDV
jgi:hypothetical protein